jgi:hypothetical protein
MTQEQKRIKLAEAAGWRLFSQFKNLWAPPKHVVEYDCDAYPLPDYFNDLNAVQELQDKLTNDQQFEFVYHLNDVLELVPLSSPASYREVVLFAFANATAAQRAEAIGLALNLW